MNTVTFPKEIRENRFLSPFSRQTCHILAMQPSVKKTTAKAAQKTPWLLDIRVDGKRVRRYFATEGQANDELSRIKIKMRKEGQDALKLTDPQRVQAYEAFQ